MSDVIERLAKLEAEATPKPWGADSIEYPRGDTRVHVTSGAWDLAYIVPDAPPEIRDSSQEQRVADAVFIAALRNAAPVLLDIAAWVEKFAGKHDGHDTECERCQARAALDRLDEVAR